MAVVNGEKGLADAVSVGAAAAKNEMPIIFTLGTSIPKTIDAWIKSQYINKSYVIGGTTVISDTIKDKLPNNERIYGNNRNDTNAKVIEKFYTSENLKTVYIANDSISHRDGNKLIDALAVGPVAAKNNAPVAIVGNKLSNTQKEVFSKKRFDTLIQVGGQVSSNPVKELQEIQKNIDELNTVSSVKITNAKNLEIKFNTSIDKDSIINSDGTLKPKISLTNGTGSNAVNLNGANAKLDSSRTTLTITLGVNNSMRGNYLIDINGISSNSVALKPYNGTLVANDRTAPTVNVAYNSTTDRFEFELSEPIDAKTIDANIALNIGSVQISKSNILFDGYAIGASQNANKVINKFEVPRSATGVSIDSTASIKIADIKDSVGNIMVKTTKSVKVHKVGDLAISNLNYVLDDTVRLTFNKKLKNDSEFKSNRFTPSGGSATNIVTIDNTTTTSNTGINVLSISNAPKEVNANGNVYDIKLSGLKYNNGANQNIKLTLNSNYAFVDETGSSTKLSSSKNYKTLTMTKDKTAPTVSSTRLSTDRSKIEVTLSEVIKSSPNSANVSIFKDDIKLSSSIMGALSSDGKSFTVTSNDSSAIFDGKLKLGSYKIRFESGAFSDLNGINNNLITTSSLLVRGEGKNLDVQQTNDEKIANKFNIVAPVGETFIQSSKSYTNFRVDGKSLDPRTSIELDKNKITITLLPTDTVKVTKDGISLVTSSLTFESGNIVNQLNTTVSLTDNSEPELISSELIKGSNASKFVLSFDENIEDNASILDATSMEDIKDKIEIKAGTSTSSLNKIYNYGTTDDESIKNYDSIKCEIENNKLIIYIAHPSSSDKSNWLDIVKQSYVNISLKSGLLKDISIKNNVLNRGINSDMKPKTGTVNM
ncbi:cell wall-binding repeat-containing protein [Faecalimicrobium sp. JNUCC 81]